MKLPRKYRVGIIDGFPARMSDQVLDGQMNFWDILTSENEKEKPKREADGVDRHLEDEGKCLAR